MFSTINHQPCTGEGGPEPQGAATVLLGKQVQSLPPTINMPALGALHFPLAAVAWSDAGQTTLSVLNAPGLAGCWWGAAPADNPLWDLGEIVEIVINR